ncbi:MAG TPA: Gldg family protein [Acetobacteraceae bacterium]|nr:Gldg family protein [Acetobacteraceae bacterium]
MRRSPILWTVAGLFFAGLLFVSVNSIVNRLFSGASIDLTDQGLYTVSPGTRAVLSHIDEPITLKFYYSPRLGETVPSYGVYASRVRALLQRYASLANGKIHLEILDPKPFSDIEDQATAAGLQAVPLEQGGESVYFGIAGSNSTDDTQNIPFFQRDREKFLEYDLTRLVQTLAFPRKKAIGLMSSLELEGDPMAQMRGQPSQPQAIIEELHQDYDIKDIATSADSIPDDIDVLVIVQPDKLSDTTQYAIDQFVMRGGHVLVFADPYSEFAAQHRSPMSPPGTGESAHFERMLHAWGVNLTPNKFVADRNAATQVNAGDQDHPLAADYLAWLSLRGDDINANDPITGRLTQINVGTAGAIAPVKGATTTFEPLLQSSADSELMNTNRVAGMPVPDILGLQRDFQSANHRYTIAARITGPADTAFPAGPPKSTDKTAKPPTAPQIKKAEQPVDIVVVADTDLLDDRFWIDFQDFMGRKVGTPISNNGDFVQNAVDSLAGSAELINLRSRGSSARPFTLVDTMRKTASAHYEAHEKELQGHLQETQQKLADIKPQEDANGDITLTADQQKTVDQFRNEIIKTRTELRQVQLALRENIDRVKNRMVFFDVILMPLLVALIAIVIGVFRVRRRSVRRTVH